MNDQNQIKEIMNSNDIVILFAIEDDGTHIAFKGDTIEIIAGIASIINCFKDRSGYSVKKIQDLIFTIINIKNKLEGETQQWNRQVLSAKLTTLAE